MTDWLIDACDECGTRWHRPSYFPALPCEACHRLEHAAALWKYIEEANPKPTELRMHPVPYDRLGQMHVLVDSDGKYYVARAPYFSDAWRRNMDRSVAEMMRLREENRDLLAENARLRRRLEGK